MSDDLYNLGRDAMDAGRLEEAIALFQQSICEFPHFKNCELIGECLMRLNRYQEAVVYLAAATTLNRGVRAPSLLAQACHQIKDEHRAREAAEIALEREPNNRLAKQILSELPKKNSE